MFVNKKKRFEKNASRAIGGYKEVKFYLVLYYVLNSNIFLLKDFTTLGNNCVAIRSLFSVEPYFIIQVTKVIKVVRVKN